MATPNANKPLVQCGAHFTDQKTLDQRHEVRNAFIHRVSLVNHNLVFGVLCTLYFAPSRRAPQFPVNALSSSTRSYTSTALHMRDLRVTYSHYRPFLSIVNFSLQIHVVKARICAMALLPPLKRKLLPRLKTPHQGHVWITLFPTPPLKEWNIQVTWKQRSELVLLS